MIDPIRRKDAVREKGRRASELKRRSKPLFDVVTFHPKSNRVRSILSRGVTRAIAHRVLRGVHSFRRMEIVPHGTFKEGDEYSLK